MSLWCFGPVNDCFSHLNCEPVFFLGYRSDRRGITGEHGVRGKLPGLTDNVGQRLLSLFQQRQ